MRVILESKSNDLLVSTDFLRSHFGLNNSDQSIRQLLAVAIEYVELSTGSSLITKTWKVIHNNNYINLPFGPVIRVISACDASNKPAEYEVKRYMDSLILQFKSDSTFKVRYEAGYSAQNIPNCLFNTIVEKFWDLYSKELRSSSFFAFDSSASISDSDQIFGISAYA